ncbi:hypothetical protein DV707_10825 [Halobellus limi]|uniref:Transposase DDE domain-containing protein n=1 Tax=Halobellus limi TaxID=699433 RepID=A0A1H5ZFC5_9EURY|nr:hypothetical protein DV707_10825 [Halobellus limi]SEG34971.1 hypothetical protein SAMN04488133_1974 [Halobellus limi]
MVSKIAGNKPSHWYTFKLIRLFLNIFVQAIRIFAVIKKLIGTYVRIQFLTSSSDIFSIA